VRFRYTSKKRSVEELLTRTRVPHNLQVREANVPTNDNHDTNTSMKELLTMSLQLLPLSETIPSWKRDAYESNNPARAFISYSHCDNEWELRMSSGQLVETHRHRDELVVELEIWRGIWNKKWGII